MIGPYDCPYCWTSASTCDAITRRRLTGDRVRCCVECEKDANRGDNVHDSSGTRR